MKPLVSIAIPCYNAESVLPLALCSVIAQTFTNWECIVVDDGSDDNPESVVTGFNDPRIRFFRLEKNSGRAVARQFALDKARGDYLAMVDADDWIIPEKLQLQLDEFDRDPSLTLVSCMVAINDEGNLVGVRGAIGENNRFEGFLNRFNGSLPIIHAASLIRMGDAKNGYYDCRNIIGEDTAFLLNVLWGKKYCVINEPLYIYNEISSFSIKKVLTGYATVRRLLIRHRKINRYYFIWWFVYILKSVIVMILNIFGLCKRLPYNRLAEPSESQMHMYISAKKMVQSIYDNRCKIKS
jgi:hypothetical protein